MAQDNTPAIVMYKGPQADGYSIPFDKGFYGEVKVAFVRRGLTDYEYNPTTFSVDGELYAWEYEEEQGAEKVKKYYYTKSNTDKVFGSNNKQIQGVTLVSIAGAVAKFSDGKEGIRTRKKDIFFHSLLDWTGEPLGDDDWICIVRETVKKQPYSYPNNQKHIEGALDNLSRQIQELKAQSDVSLKVDPTFVQDPAKMNPIDWLNTIVRSTDTTARGLRYRNFWVEYSTDDPNKAESDKSWTKLLNTTNITSVREWYDEDNNKYIPQYSMDGGATWKGLATTAEIYTKTEIDGKLTAIGAQIDANADAIQKTREDYIQADSEIHQILNNHAENLTTLHNDVDDLGEQVANIESKIPDDTSDTNPLINKQQLLDEEMDIREDLNSGLSELQTQITAQAAEIATKQDQLTAGDNIVISNNVISATGAGGGAGFDIVVVQELPATGQKGIIYLLAKDGAAPDVYDEYVWVTATQTFELIGTTQVDLSNYLPLSGGTVKGVVKVQNGQGTGSLWIGADVNNTTLTNNQRHLARIVVPSFTNTERGATLLGWDSSGDANVPIVNNSADVVGFGGSKKITNATSPMGISFCVTKIRESMSASDKVYALAMDANGSTFGVPVFAPELSIGTSEGTLSFSITAGVATIASNNGIDVASHVKFDYAPTTDDNTTYANALDTSFLRKAQVATAIADAVANVDALPDQTGNAGKVLVTDGAEASWQDAPAGGTKITIKRYE